jgi:2-hydroxy-3-keto-5-methylthiopentenyl-1-phosphate phosphatase
VRDLHDVAAFLDFDGTIVLHDTTEHLLRSFAGERWWVPGQRYRAGEITSQECLRWEWSLLPHDMAVLRAGAREVPRDPGFVRFVADLRHAGATVTVVSDGFGFYVEDECRPLGLPVLTAEVRDGELVFPHRAPGCPCAGCGTCKVGPVLRAKREGFTTVLVGDGPSDRRAALVADRVLAKNGLADWCAEERIEHVRFGDLTEARTILVDERAQAWR